MADEREALADQWLRRIRNHPVFAVLIVAGALIGIVTPLWSLMGTMWPDPPGMARDVTAAALRADRDKILVPARNALRENRAVFELLNTSLYLEPPWGIQESYYRRVQRDGPELHASMRGQIESLVQNNRKVLDLLDGYMGRARTRAFIEQEALFRQHARRYETRWQHMKESALSGEPQPVNEPVFPSQFPASLEAEIDALNKKLSAAS